MELDLSIGADFDVKEEEEEAIAEIKCYENSWFDGPNFFMWETY